MSAKATTMENPGFRVLGFRWLGVATADLPGSRAFYEGVLGLRASKEGRGGSFVEFELESGQRFELFGRKSRSYALHQIPVLAFEVDDIRRARAALKRAGVEILTRTATYAEDASWFYFRSPDGIVFEIQQWASRLRPQR